MVSHRRSHAKWIAKTAFLALMLIPAIDGMTFGFFAHRKINRMAVFTLPPEMIGFFKKHVEYLTEHAIDPDRRAHAVPGEAPRHYIDIDHYGADPFDIVPRRWNDAVAMFSEDTLMEKGVLPWHIQVMMYRLINAFQEKDIDRIIYNATHIGHYVADACTPLHTTKYYNGRTPEQRGIHALWESRVPEMLAGEFNYFVGRASFIESPLDYAWELVKMSHMKVDTIFGVYDSLMTVYTSDQYYAHEMRGQATVRTYSREFTLAFHTGTNQMVERQMQLAVKSIGDFWFTAWVLAGQPDLYKLEERAISQRHRRMLKEEEHTWNQVNQAVGRPNPGQ
jgi:hypothetical protein